eukprot:TRINITY_DN25897_c0_g1_i1.p1 TRINITY_DN25897_c0_g1~~TRINITY_DN25897_c0_g1_i1.p1  ORF type:complete len:271 (+),score=20.50 TRINITY_DN25897_c0_g1_i1:61-813(+)
MAQTHDVGAETNGHVNRNVRARECLDGTFLDASDAGAWLLRDQLVHKQRYAAMCTPIINSGIAAVIPALGLRISPRVSEEIETTALAVAVAGVFFCLVSYIRGARPIVVVPWRHETAYTAVPTTSPCTSAGRFTESHQYASPPSSPKTDPSTAFTGKFGRFMGIPLSRTVSDSSDASPLRREQWEQTAEEAIRQIHEDLVDHIDLPPDQRKSLLRKYQRRWHPDKNASERRSMATEVMPTRGVGSKSKHR